jgi:hypothetical protein
MINMFNQTTGRGSLIKIKGIVLASLIAGAIALPLVIPAQRALAGDEHHEHSEGLVGSWSVQVTLDPNTVPPGTPLTFMGLFTFSAGGGYVQSNTGPAAGGPPVQGNWVRTGHGQFAATGLRFGFDASHHFTGVNKIRDSLILNDRGDEITGVDQVDIFLPDGTLLPIHPEGTYHGTRVAIEPLH